MGEIDSKHTRWPKDLRSKGQGSNDSNLLKRGAENIKKPKGKMQQNGRQQVKTLRETRGTLRERSKMTQEGFLGEIITNLNGFERKSD